MSALTVGYIPSQLSFYEEELAPVDAMGDSIAKIVMERFRKARQVKSSNSIYQGKSTVTLLREADYAAEKRFTSEQSEALMQAFGFCPSRYYGLSAAKTTEIANWKSELVASDPGALVKIIPTPAPRLPRASVIKIKSEVKQELMQRMLAAGVGDPTMLLSVSNGRLHDSVKKFLDEKSDLLRQVEQAKIVSAAMGAASKIQLKMRDLVVEGDFREAYAGFSTNQIKYGIGIMRFPYWQRRVVAQDNQDMKGKVERMWKTMPTFQSVSPWNFFTTDDGRSVNDVTACMEYREITKTTLVGLTNDSRYDREAILDILDDYSMRSRAWLFPEAGETESEGGSMAAYWGPDEIVAVLHHEGFVTGKDLYEYGLTGYDDTTVYNIAAEVCCGRAIRVEVKDPTKDLPRSYAVSHYEELGNGVWNSVGVPAILHDTQERINVMYHCYENNMDWSLRPPLQTNPEALKNPGEARNIRPGGKYEVSDLIGPGVSPDPIRTIRGPSAQYQMVYPLIQQMIRQADSECGVPTLSDLSTFGRGSLGELSARISAAVRRVRNAAFSEDRSMKGIWEVLFAYVLDENPELVENADLDMDYVGVVGLLTAEQERKAKVERLQLVMQATQAGIAPPQVAQFAYEDILKDYGVPTDALGMENPLITNAIATAMQGGIPAASATGSNLAGAPQLDGRSGAISSIPSAIAAPNGASQIVPPSGM